MVHREEIVLQAAAEGVAQEYWIALAANMRQSVENVDQQRMGKAITLPVREGRTWCQADSVREEEEDQEQKDVRSEG